MSSPLAAKHYLDNIKENDNNLHVIYIAVVKIYLIL